MLTQQPQSLPTDVIHWRACTAGPGPMPDACYKKKRENIGGSIRSCGKKARLNIYNKRGREGHIRLFLIPICFSDAVKYRPVLSNRPQLIDICLYIGWGDNTWRMTTEEQEERVCKLYFDPLMYPAPHDLSKGGDTATFNNLKGYIRSSASIDKSPVSCIGGNQKYHAKEFGCTKYFKNSKGKWKRCPFSFQVRWDHQGYFIHLLPKTHWYRNCGLSWHCCKNTL